MTIGPCTDEGLALMYAREPIREVVLFRNGEHYQNLQEQAQAEFTAVKPRRGKGRAC